MRIVQGFYIGKANDFMPGLEIVRILRLFAQGLNINEITEKFPSLSHDKVRDLLGSLIEQLERTPVSRDSSPECIAHIDGACRGNPGQGGLGVVIVNQQGMVIKRVEEKIGLCTNNVAEYKALIRALEECSHLTHGEVLIKSDSQLLVRQLQGTYRIKDEKIKTLYQEARELQKKFSLVRFIHVPRAENAIADKLANEALDSAG